MPSVIFSLLNIQVLDLGSNLLQVLEEDVGNLENLKVYYSEFTDEKLYGFEKFSSFSSVNYRVCWISKI